MLTDRLLAISKMIIAGQAAADIGSDHAFLPIYLVEQGIVPKAIATELSDGPLSRAQEAIENCSFPDSIELRKGDGLQPLTAGEAATVIIAGMGGETICSILSCDWDKAASFQRFVFQPMSRAYMLRAYLAEQGWPILGEKLVIENKRIFVIISSSPGKIPYKLSQLELDIGPIILDTKDSDWGKFYLEQWMAKYKAVHKSLLRSNTFENSALILDYQQRIEGLEAILDASES